MEYLQTPLCGGLGTDDIPDVFQKLGKVTGWQDGQDEEKIQKKFPILSILISCYIFFESPTFEVSWVL